MAIPLRTSLHNLSCFYPYFHPNLGCILRYRAACRQTWWYIYKLDRPITVFAVNEISNLVKEVLF